MFSGTKLVFVFKFVHKAKTSDMVKQLETQTLEEQIDKLNEPVDELDEPVDELDELDELSMNPSCHIEHNQTE